LAGVSSRQKEKERRRQERLERERAAAAAAQRKRRFGLVAGGGLAVVAIAAIAVVALAGGGKDSVAKPTGGLSIADAPIPAARDLPLAQAAKAAGCTARTFPSEGRTHVLTPVTYKTNPPTSGNHNPTPAHDGIYDPGNTPAKENLVHSLEHGRIEVQYKPGSSRRTIGQLQSLVKQMQDQGDPRLLLFENETSMPYAVAATAWTHMLACPAMNQRVPDAIRAFTKTYDLKAPETQYIGPE
jgi:hypothetical protein